METYNFKMRYFSGVKCFWPVQNNHPVTDAIKKLNSRSKAFLVATYGFSTLYINISHNKLNNVVRELINFCFKGWKKQFIDLTKSDVTWLTIKTFDKASLKLTINFLLDNCFFFIFCDFPSRQITGITMGSDPAPFIGKYIFTSLWNKRL